MAPPTTTTASIPGERARVLASSRPACRFCAGKLTRTVLDLGMSPPSDGFLSAERLDAPETFYPLHLRLCDRCFLLQLPASVSREEIFSEYAYFSSYSESFVSHARAYTEAIVSRLALTGDSLVVEVGSNDGYLLQHFVEKGIPVLGVEPAGNVARAASERLVPTLVEFFGLEIADRLVEEGRQADLLVGNNVLAQVPDVNDFVAGLKRLLAPQGVVTLEFPHVLSLLERNLFDTVYHEHFSYFSLLTATRILEAAGLTVFDLEEISVHGGSIRLFARHSQDRSHSVTERVAEFASREERAGLHTFPAYAALAPAVEAVKRRLLAFLVGAKEEGRAVAGYGAPGKATTLLNYCGIGTDLLEYTVDRNPYKHGRFVPGRRIPIFPPERLRETRPDYVLILPWNLRDEIVDQLAYARSWGARFVVALPELEVLR